MNIIAAKNAIIIAIIMIIIFCMETRSAKIGSVSVIKMLLFFLLFLLERWVRELMCGAFQIQSLRGAAQNF